MNISDEMIDEVKRINEAQSKKLYRVYKKPENKDPVVISYYQYSDYDHCGKEDFDKNRFLSNEFETKEEAKKYLKEFKSAYLKLKVLRLEDDN